LIAAAILTANKYIPPVASACPEFTSSIRRQTANRYSYTIAITTAQLWYTRTAPEWLTGSLPWRTSIREVSYESSHWTIGSLLTFSEAQTEIKEASDSPTADDFLAREKAILGDDAAQFADDGDDDLLGGSSDPAPAGGDSTFESQFPDIQNATEVRQTPCSNPQRDREPVLTMICPGPSGTRSICDLQLRLPICVRRRE
jgi:hypothetical protein